MRLTVKNGREYEIRDTKTNVLIATFYDFIQAQQYMGYANAKQQMIDLFYSHLSEELDIDFKA